MRVIAGSARSLPLCAPEGLDTRPTQDRIKETLFNILLGAGNGVMNSTMGNMEEIASNIMEIYPGRTSKPYGGLKEGRWLRLTEKDASFVEGSAFSDVVDRVSPTKSLDGSNYKLSYGKTKATVYVQGVGPDYSEINKVEIYAGRILRIVEASCWRVDVVKGGLGCFCFFAF